MSSYRSESSLLRFSSPHYTDLGVLAVGYANLNGITFKTFIVSVYVYAMYYFGHEHLFLDPATFHSCLLLVIMLGLATICFVLFSFGLLGRASSEMDFRAHTAGSPGTMVRSGAN